MIWYKEFLGKIEPVELRKVTEKTVTLANGQRMSRDGWQFFGPTWEDVHAHLLAKAEKNVISARRVLENAQGELGNVKGMKPASTDSGEVK